MRSSKAACLRERARAFRNSLILCPKALAMVGRLLTYQPNVKAEVDRALLICELRNGGFSVEFSIKEHSGAGVYRNAVLPA